MDTLVKLRERRSVAVDTTEGGKPDKAAVNAVEHSAQDRQRGREVRAGPHGEVPLVICQAEQE